MKSLKKILKIRNLKASSLIEALIALVILIIITSFILLIMNNVNNRSNIGLKTRAFNEVNNIFNHSLSSKDFSERRIDCKNFIITCQASEFEESKKLLVFKVTAVNNKGIAILSKQRLVKVDSDKNIIAGY